MARAVTTRRKAVTSLIAWTVAVLIFFRSSDFRAVPED